MAEGHFGRTISVSIPSLEETMLRKIKASAAAVLCCTVVGAGLAGTGTALADEWDPLATASGSDWDPLATASGSDWDPLAPAGRKGPISGTEKIKIAGKSVNVSCSGVSAKGEPVVVLMLGAGDGLAKMAALQKALSEQHRVCSYDRLGAGASDRPDGPQSFSSTGKILTGVLDRVAGDRPVVLAGHSLGGLIAARYAPAHRGRVKGLVLMDATSPTMAGDIKRAIPKSAKGPAAQFRAQNLAVLAGQNPEKLVMPDGKVRSAGNIPVRVIKHGKPYLTAIPQYGARLERAWSAGQRKWLALSGRASLSTAKSSEHNIYLDQPEVAVRAIRRVASQAAR